MLRKFNGAALAALLWLAPFAAFAQPAAMIYGTDAVTSPDAVSLPQPTEEWFTQLNVATNRGTQVPSYWVNKVGGELSAAIQSGCAQTLSMTVRTQLSTCIGGIHGRLISETVFTSSGTFTAPAGANSFDVEALAGGGAGGNAAATSSAQISVGSGGGSGAHARVFITTGSLGSVTVTIGAGGHQGGTVAGGTTSFGSYVNCAGGSAGGNGAAWATPVTGQTGQGMPGWGCTVGAAAAIIQSGGMPGENGLMLGSTTMSGHGGSGPWGGGGPNTSPGNGSPAQGPGSGGGGAACNQSCGGNTGGDGGGGEIIIRTYS